MVRRENMPGLARPVRMDDRSSRATETAFSIFSSASKRVSSIKVSSPVTSALARRPRPSSGDQRSDLLTRDGTRDISVGEEIEHQNRHAVVHTEAERGGVGDLEAAVDDLAMGDRGEKFGVGI